MLFFDFEIRIWRFWNLGFWTLDFWILGFGIWIFQPVEPVEVGRGWGGKQRGEEASFSELLGLALEGFGFRAPVLAIFWLLGFVFFQKTENLIKKKRKNKHFQNFQVLCSLPSLLYPPFLSLFLLVPPPLIFLFLLIPFCIFKSAASIQSKIHSCRLFFIFLTGSSSFSFLLSMHLLYDLPPPPRTLRNGAPGTHQNRTQNIFSNIFFQFLSITGFCQIKSGILPTYGYVFW